LPVELLVVLVPVDELDVPVVELEFIDELLPEPVVLPVEPVFPEELLVPLFPLLFIPVEFIDSGAIILQIAENAIMSLLDVLKEYGQPIPVEPLIEPEELLFIPDPLLPLEEELLFPLPDVEEPLFIDPLPEELLPDEPLFIDELLPDELLFMLLFEEPLPEEPDSFVLSFIVLFDKTEE